jgi:hypothetical protein
MKRLLTTISLALFVMACSSGQTVTKKDADSDAKTSDSQGQVDVTTEDTPALDQLPSDLPQCTTHEECAAIMGEIGPCKLALCDTALGTCMAGDMKSGAPCDDEDACSLESFCQDGNCLGSGELTCDDQDPCTLDSCDDEDGCTYNPLSGPACDDGNPCTVDDVCNDGTCSGDQEACDCEDVDDCAQFDDGDLCNGSLDCVNGSCVPLAGSEIICPATDNLCVLSKCNPDSGLCLNAPVDDGDDCSDGDGCTVGDSCQDGACVSGAAYVCDACQSDADCIGLDSANKCMGTHVCDDDKCVIDPSTVPMKPEVACFSAVCDPATGQFVVNQLADGTFCDDQNACTVQDKCSNATCKGVAASCDDGNICTNDSCDPESGCTTEGLSELPCDDMDACTAEDTCLDGVCSGAETLSCDDENPCTDDSCDSESGCLNETLDDVPCDDGEVCTDGDMCEEGVCIPGENLCQCDVDDDCSNFEDLDVCNGTLHCVDQKCVADPETIVICDSSEDTACTKTVCDPQTGECGPKDLGLGAPCDDKNACTLGESCFFGDCVGGILVGCNDGNPCTSDSCDPDFGCLDSPLDEVPCQDGDACTEGDACQAGECQPGLNICGCENDEDCAGFEDGNLCNGTLHCVDSSCTLDEATIVTCEEPESTCEVNVCAPLSGECKVGPVKDGTICDDEDACTENDVCADGECIAFEILCDDSNPCTEDVCVGDEGCVFTPTDGAACDDGEVCTEGDVCDMDQCVPGTNACDCEEDLDCADSEDGNLCNGILVCQENACVIDPGSVVTCDTSADTACTKNQCNPTSGECELTLSQNGSVCEDDLLCTEYSVCQDGECIGELKDCDDDNPCTDDVCLNQQGGCVYQDNTASCNDGNSCTQNDFCQDGACVGAAILCDDDNICTADSCNPLSGCLFEPTAAACDDGDACTEDDACQQGECSGKPVLCDDDNVCTDDSCDPATGCVAYPNEDPCDDDDPCTDGDFCAGAECNGGPPTNCDDANSCTEDLCSKADGCINNTLSGVACDDGNPCTSGDICDDGECVYEKPTECDDFNPCTANSCDPQTGCLADPISGTQCNDENACTVDDICTAGECSGGLISCNDNDPCTQDLCDPASGCLHPPTAGQPVCDDGNGCTLVDKCQGGLCVGSSPKPCDDGNICTNDSCSPLSGACTFTANTAPCNDGNICTVTDTCANKQCVGGGSLNCDDDNPCTDDSCDPDGGCVHADNGICQCEEDDDCSDDGNPCNGTPICVNNACVTDPNSLIICSTENDTTCLKNKCIPEQGACVMTPEPSNKFCNDENPCTSGDHCDGAGACLGNNILCNDNNLCTSDSCDPNSGCVYSNNALPCDDGDSCTLDDQCAGGNCSPGDDYDCNDGNICTQDVCVPLNGVPTCNNLPAAGACDDNNACTDGDQCVDATCVGQSVECDDENICTQNLCDAVSGCTYPAELDGFACDDLNVCTVSDTCQEGACQSGSWAFNCCNIDDDCEDNFECTSDSCIGGTCDFALMDCDDNNLCTADTCAGGVCGNTPLSSDVVIFEQDFDDGTAPGWLFTTGTTQNSVGSEDIYWSVNDFRANSADYSLYGGNPEDQTYDHGNGTALAYSPPMRLPSDSAIELTFALFADFKEQVITYDRLQVLVLPAGAQEPTSLTPWIYQSVGGENGEFVEQTYVLDEYAGQEVRVVFAFITPDSFANDAEGVYIDDVAVVAAPRDGCCFYDSHCDDANLCSADNCDDFECSYPYVGGAYFSEDFDTGSVAIGESQDSSKWYLVHSSNGQVGWFVDEVRAESTPHAFHAGTKNGTYDGGTAFSVTARSPLFVLPVNADALLKFDVYTDLTQPDCVNDVLSVGISTSIVGNIKWLYQKCDSTKNFVPVSLSLADYEGKSQLFIHLKFTANKDKNSGEGVYIDNLQVVKAEDPKTCCSQDKDCDDEDLCTVNWCTGVPDGAVCAQRAVTDFQDNFDDGNASGWIMTPLGNGGYVTWQANNYRYYSSKYSLYAGYPAEQRYYGWGTGTTSAATPYFLLDSVEKSSPVLIFNRYLSLCTATGQHCFTATVQQKNGVTHTLEQICGSTDGDPTNFWTNKQFDLYNFMGKEIRIIFALSVPYDPYCAWQKKEGAYVDDVRVFFKNCN